MIASCGDCCRSVPLPRQRRNPGVKMNEDSVSVGDGPAPTTPRIAFLGSAAQRWFASRGWWAHPLAGSEPFRVFADEVSIASFVVRRVWHTAAVLTPTTPTSARDLQPAVLLQVEGSVTVDTASSTPVTLSPGGAVLLPPGIVPAFQSPQSSARIEVRARPRLPAARGTRRILTAGAPTTSWRLLANTVNAFLNCDVDTEADSFTAIQSAIEYLATALAVEIALNAQDTDDPPLMNSFARLRSRSDRIIYRNADSASFTVARLAAELGVSRSYLARAYAEADTTPSERIRTVRLELLGGTPPDVRDETHATLVGFSSLRALKRAARTTGART